MGEDRNFFLITVDDLRKDRTSLEQERDTTPFLKSFAEENQYLQNHFSNGPASPSSFRSIFTSTYPMEFDDYNYLSGKRPYLPEILSDSGVKTSGISTNPYVSRYFGFEKGYDEFNQLISDRPWTGKEKNLKDKVLRFLRNTVKKTPFSEHLRVLRDELRGRDTPYMEAETVVEEAKSMIESSEDGEDGFYWVHFMDTHDPFMPPDETFGTWSDFDSKVEAWDVLDVENLGASEQALDLYDECILYLDRNLEDLVKFIQDRFEGRDYTIIITSDHGELFRALDEWSLGYDSNSFGHPEDIHQKLFEVPLFIESSRDIQRELTTHIDLLPTVLDYFDVENPEGAHGISLFGDEDKKIDFVEAYPMTDDGINSRYEDSKAGKVTKEGLKSFVEFKDYGKGKNPDIDSHVESRHSKRSVEEEGEDRNLSEREEEEIKENLSQLGYTD